MNYYVIRVTPRREHVFQQQANRQLDDPSVVVMFPRRKLLHVRRGVRKEEEVALFPGYVFLRVHEPLDSELYRKLKALPAFLTFLKSEGEVHEVLGPDLKLLSQFLRFGEVVPTSQVWFDENSRIRVHSGPMVGMEGQVIHVDRRKRRAKVQLDFDHGEFTITLGFELMEHAPVAEQAASMVGGPR